MGGGLFGIRKLLSCLLNADSLFGIGVLFWRELKTFRPRLRERDRRAGVSSGARPFRPGFAELQPGGVDFEDLRDPHDLARPQAFTIFYFLYDGLIRSGFLGQLILGKSFLSASGTQANPDMFGT